MSKLIYVTGAPATGKSTLTDSIGQRFPGIRIFTYSKELLAFVQGRGAVASSQDDLRRNSAKVITREDVEAVDAQLLALAHESRGKRSLVVDSHPVTIESFGFRVTPFRREQLHALAPDVIVCLYAEAAVIAERITKAAAGRPLPSHSDLELHTNLQATVANLYAFETGAPIYFLDASVTPEELLENFLQVTRLP